MKIGDSRGLSTVVTTLILVLLVIVAIVIVWAVIINLIETRTEGIDPGRISLTLEVTSAVPNGNVLDVTIFRRVGDGDLRKVLISLTDGTNTVTSTHPLTLDEFSQTTIPVDVSGLSGGSSSVTKVTVIPLLGESDVDGKPAVLEISGSGGVGGGFGPNLIRDGMFSAGIGCGNAPWFCTTIWEVNVASSGVAFYDTNAGGSALSQTMIAPGVESGKMYELTFDKGTTRNTFEISVGSQVIYTYSAVGGTGLQTVPFTATTTSSSFKIAQSGLPVGATTQVDDIVLREV